MAIVLSHQSALDCMGLQWFDDGLPRCGLTSADLRGPTQEEVHQMSMLLYQEERPLHVLVAPSANRRCGDTLVKHRFARGLPPDSFFRFHHGVYVCSPELALVQMAKGADPVDTILLADRLCAAFVQDESMVGGVRKRQPLTTTAKITEYVRKSPGVSGIAQVKKALRHIDDEAASPREIALAMLLCLPNRLGGYGLPPAELNGRVTVFGEQSRGCSAAKYCDMLWRAQKVAIEYESSAFHGNAETLRADSRRRSILQASGYQVVTVTNSQIKDPREFYVVAHNIARLLKTRVRTRVQDWSQRHLDLRKAIGL
ncbi:MAG: hypothetical protein PUD02_05870 [Eggerthellales bacterium]|nr:hypothetical protein [Eggerthellales bacterium]